MKGILFFSFVCLFCLFGFVMYSIFKLFTVLKSGKSFNRGNHFLTFLNINQGQALDYK
jgi:hypothetical protein